MPSHLEDHTGYWVNRLRTLVHERFAARLAGSGVTVAQWSVLILIYQGEATTPQTLAQALDLDPGAMTRLLARLEAKGLIRRAIDPQDRRRIGVSLTPAAIELTPKLAALADQNDAEFFSILTHDEHQRLRELLEKLVREARNISASDQ